MLGLRLLLRRLQTARGTCHVYACTRVMYVYMYVCTHVMCRVLYAVYGGSAYKRTMQQTMASNVMCHVQYAVNGVCYSKSLCLISFNSSATCWVLCAIYGTSALYELLLCLVHTTQTIATSIKKIWNVAVSSKYDHTNCYYVKYTQPLPHPNPYSGRLKGRQFFRTVAD